jgi:3-hydroxybutyryl-CoA dehydrogenase
VGVIGAGQMGHGIAWVSAGSGFDVRLCDISQEAVAQGYAQIESGTAGLVRKSYMTEDERSELLGRIETTSEMADLADCDAVIEAATENAEIKFEIFGKLDRICPPETLLLSNTSSISITHIGGNTNRADHVMGIHFMNPVPRMKLVELIRGLVTSEETYDRVVAFTEALGKEAVTSEDYPGFIVNRILIPMINEACYALMERVGEVEDIDKALRLGANHPMGPLALADFIGLDTCLAIMTTLHTGLGDAKYRPCPLLQRYVRAGFLGRKTGRGFYTY